MNINRFAVVVVKIFGWQLLVGAVVLVPYAVQFVIDVSEYFGTRYGTGSIFELAEMLLRILLYTFVSIFVLIGNKSLAAWLSKKLDPNPENLVLSVAIILLRMGGVGFLFSSAAGLTELPMSLYSLLLGYRTQGLLLELATTLARIMLSLVAGLSILGWAVPLANWLTGGIDKNTNNPTTDSWPPAPNSDV
jgi:hypothetical protein